MTAPTKAARSENNLSDTIHSQLNADLHDRTNEESTAAGEAAHFEQLPDGAGQRPSRQPRVAEGVAAAAGTMHASAGFVRPAVPQILHAGKQPGAESRQDSGMAGAFALPMDAF